ncbi:type II toxin-antitoxin system HicA family toxin [Candidatus Gottesmanbacteria bacterium]|nr:type II toxin-antitoxin system HicA family toxin [Candidatus Gottesmanbacteria bacterium]
MPKLPVVSGQDAVKALKKLGFSHVSTRGSHMKLVHPDGRIATVPNHKTLKKGTLKKGILNPLSISVEQFIDQL